MNTPWSSFLVCSPFFCLKKMRAAPDKRETARTIKPATKPKMQYTMIKPRMDVASLYSHEFERFLESLEHGITDVLAVFSLFCHVVSLLSLLPYR